MSRDLPHITRRFGELLQLSALELQQHERIAEPGAGDGEADTALQVRRQVWLTLASAYLDVAALCYGLPVSERRG